MKNAIFISYAHIDNLPSLAWEKGWVNSFHEELQVQLLTLIGDKVTATIWRDRELQGNTVFPSEIIDQINRANILIPVLSESYIKSEWCQKELHHFCNNRGETIALLQGNQSRIFKVLKTYLPPDQHPAQLQGMMGYELYELDAAGKVMGYTVTDPKFWGKIQELASDIHAFIKKQSGRAERSSSNNSTVYLAVTSSDLNNERNQIKCELQQNGFTVLPDEDLPLTAEEMKQAVRRDLQSCSLSVHLIGKHYGMVPEGAKRSIIHLQHDLAMECSRSHGLGALVWMPATLEPDEELQCEFIGRLQNSADPVKGFELLRTTLEDLKTHIHTRLRRQQWSLPPRPAGNCPPRLYLMCDEQDDEAADQLESHLFDQGLEVLRLTNDVLGKSRKRLHQHYLLYCDAVMVFCQKAGKIWLEMKRIDLWKLPGIRGGRPPLVKPLFLFAGEQTPYKERFRTLESEILPMYGGFDPSRLAEYIVALKSAALNR